MDKKNISIGIVGVGMVGAAVSKYYEQRADVCVRGYDKNKNIGSLEDALSADYIFLCLPTPTRESGEQDLNTFEETMPKLKGGSKVVIKSTVLPGTTEKYQKQRPDVFFTHNPEFLDARTAAEDFAHPDIQVVGHTAASEQFAEEIMEILPLAPNKFICASGESEMVKYFLNAFLAAKNIFANQMYDYCSARNINYEAVKNIVKRAPRMGGEVHLNIFKDGYRGFKGACLPKDVRVLVRSAEETGIPLEMLALIQKLNNKYTQESGK